MPISLNLNSSVGLEKNDEEQAVNKKEVSSYKNSFTNAPQTYILPFEYYDEKLKQFQLDLDKFKLQREKSKLEREEMNLFLKSHELKFDKYELEDKQKKLKIQKNKLENEKCCSLAVTNRYEQFIKGSQSIEEEQEVENETSNTTSSINVPDQRRQEKLTWIEMVLKICFFFKKYVLQFKVNL